MNSFPHVNMSHSVLSLRQLIHPEMMCMTISSSVLYIGFLCDLSFFVLIRFVLKV